MVSLGDVTATYSTSVYFASSYWPSNDKYKIVDYGFLEVTTGGTHPDSYNPDEISYAGPYSNNAQWFEANLNNDEHVDSIMSVIIVATTDTRLRRFNVYVH